MAYAETSYRAYLLRLWKMADAEGKPAWRASLERPGENRRQGFGTLEQAFDFIRQECGVPDQPPEPKQGSEPVPGDAHETHL